MSVSTRQKLRQFTWLAQAGCVLVAGAAVLLIASESTIAPSTSHKATPNADPAQSPGQNLAGTAQGDVVKRVVLDDISFNLTRFFPESEGIGADNGNADGTGQIPETTEVNIGPWEYLGMLKIGSSKAALVKIDSQQRIVKQGTERDGIELVSVENDSIVIRGSEIGQRRIVKSKKTGPRITFSKDSKGTTPQVAGRAFNTNETPAARRAREKLQRDRANREEVLNKMEERRILERQRRLQQDMDGARP